MATGAITEETALSGIVPIFKKAWIEIASDVTGTATYFNRTIDMGADSWTNSDEVVFTYNGETHTFEYQSSKTAINHFSSNQDFVYVFNDTLGANTFHIASLSGDVITIRSRFYGDGPYDFTLSSDAGSLGSTSGVGAYESDDWKDYTIYARFLVSANTWKIGSSNTASGGTEVAILERRKVLNNEYWFDPTRFFRTNYAHLTNNTIPTLGGKTITRFFYVSKAYFIAGEIYGDSSEALTREESLTGTAFGIFPCARPRYSDDFDEYWDYSTHGTIKFLTNCPDYQRMWAGKDIVLNWIGREGDGENANSHEMRARCVAYNYDGTTISTTTLHTLSHGAADSASASFYFAFDSTDLPAGTYRADIYIEQQLSGGGWNALTETKSFVLDEETFVNSSFLFMNSFGVYEVAHFTGEDNLNHTRDAEIYQNFEENNHTLKDGLQRTHKVNLQAQKTYFSGWLEIEEFNWFKDLIKSPNVFLIDGSDRVRVNIDSVIYKREVDETMYNIAITVLSDPENTVAA